MRPEEDDDAGGSEPHRAVLLGYIRLQELPSSRKQAPGYDKNIARMLTTFLDFEAFRPKTVMGLPKIFNLLANSSFRVHSRRSIGPETR